jgi:hypothetical protein
MATRDPEVGRRAHRHVYQARLRQFCAIIQPISRKEPDTRQTGLFNAAARLLLLWLASPLLKADLAGDWSGTLVFPQGSITLVVHVTGPDSAPRATVDSPDQNLFDVPADSVLRTGDSFGFVVQRYNARFNGLITADRIQGTYFQNGQEIPETLFRFPAAPGCALTEAKLARLARAELGVAQPWYHHSRALVFDEADCVADALDGFRRSADALGKAPQTPEIRVLLNDTKAMLQLEMAKQMNAGGEARKAVESAWDIVRTIRTANAQPRAVEFLASILPAADEPGWKELEGYLDDLGEAIPASTRLFILRRHDFLSKGSQTIAAIESELENLSDPQRCFALEILLIEFYARSGRPRDAELLLTSIESDAGEGLVDWNMRAAFLEIGSTVWAERARSDARAANKAAAYAKVLADFKFRMGRYF